MFKNNKISTITALSMMMIIMTFLQVSSSPSSGVHAQALVEPPLRDGGILVAVLIGIFMIVVPAGLINFIPAMFMLILICNFAGVIPAGEMMHGFTVSGVVAVALLGIVLDPIGRLPVIKKVSMYFFGGEKGSRTWQLFKILVGQAIFSLILPNAPHAQLFTPILRDVAVASGMHPKFVLMPMSIMIAASNFILIASASNIIASGVLEDDTGSALGMGDVFISNIVPTVVTIFMCLGLSNLLYPQEIDEETLDEIEAGKKKSAGATGFMNQTKFKGMFEVFPQKEGVSSLASSGGQTVAELVGFLPTALQAKIEVQMVEVLKDAPPQTIETSAVAENQNENKAADGESPSSAQAPIKSNVAARATNASGSAASAARAASVSGTESPFAVLTEEDAMKHVLIPGERLIVKGDVSSLRAFRTLLGLAWVGVSETSFHRGLDIVASDASLAAVDKQEERNENEPTNDQPTEKKSTLLGSDDDDEELESKKTSVVGDAQPITKSESSLSNKDANTNNNTYLKTRALYHIQESAEGLHSFLPVDRDEMKKIKFAIVVVSHNNSAVGHRLDDRLFVDTFRVTIVSCVRESDGASIFGRELSLHILQPGDALLLRLRPRATPIFQNLANLHSNFYDVEGLETANTSDKLLNNHYFIIPDFCFKCFPNWGEPVITHGGGSQRAILAPDWWPNVTILIFLGIIVAASVNVNLASASGVGVCLYIFLGIMTPREAINAIDWNLIVGIALSFGLGSAMTDSDLGPWIGYQIANSGLKGFNMIIVACFITSFFGAIVSNKGAINLLWPVLAPTMESIGLEKKVAAVILANCSIAGYFSITGCPSHMVIAGPGNFMGHDFFLYGFPIFVVFTLLTAVFVSIEYGVI